MLAQDKQYWWTGGNDSSQGLYSNKLGTNDNKNLVLVTNSQPWWTLMKDGRLIGYNYHGFCGTPLHKFEIWQKDSSYINLIDPSDYSTCPTGPYAGFLLGLKHRNAELRMVEQYPMLFFTNNIERVRISADGKVGIGTSSPTARLDLDGSFRIRNGAAEGLVLKSDVIGNATWQALNDDDATNELQDLSLNHHTLSLSEDLSSVDLSIYMDNTDTQLTESEVDVFVDNNGYLTSFTEQDGDSTNELITSVNLNGSTLEITDAGGTRGTDLSSFLDNTDTQLTETEVDAFVSNNGYLTSFTEQDGDASNELQELSLSEYTLSLSQANSLDISSINYWNKHQQNLNYTQGKVGIGIEPSAHFHVHQASFDSQEVSQTEDEQSLVGGGSLPIIQNSSSNILLSNHNTGSSVEDGLLIQSQNQNAIFHLQEEGSLYFKIKGQNRLILRNNGTVVLNRLQGNGDRILYSNSSGVLKAGEALDKYKNHWQKTENEDLYYQEDVGIGTDNPNQKLDVNGRLRVRGSDLYLGLDNGDANSQNRALVKPSGSDQLIINYAGDYSEGVLLNGAIKLTSLGQGMDGLVVADSQGQLAQIAMDSLNDNLGNHKATQVLNMSDYDIEQAHTIYSIQNRIQRGHGNWLELLTEGDNPNAWFLHSPQNNNRPNLLQWAYKTYGQAVNWNTLVLDGEQGYIGIGTSAPNAKLDVKINDNTSFRTYDYGSEWVANNNAAWARSLRFYQQGNTDKAYAIGAKDGFMFLNANFDLMNSSTGSSHPDMVITDDGNIGMGTTQPQAKLELVDNQWSTSAGLKLHDLGTGSSEGLWIQFSQGNMPDMARIGGVSTSTTEGNLSFSTKGHNDVEPVERLRITHSGRVGIGTNNPHEDYILDVRGTASFCKVEVQISGWCDYVFEEDYQLMPLSDLALYIQKNKHLPEIPSKAEVEENQLDLGEMNKLLLKKVEELTLYILEQNERIEQLEQKQKEYEEN